MISYAVQIAPVRVQHCLTVQPAGQRHLIRVSRSKDNISFSTPAIVCNALGCIEGDQRLRASDNRGPQRPAFVAPFQIEFDVESPGKRTIWITVEQISDAGECTVVATARLDLLCVIGRDNLLTKAGTTIISLSDFSVPLLPDPNLVHRESSLNLIGRRCLVDLDIVMFPSSVPAPAWPVPHRTVAATVTPRRHKALVQQQKKLEEITSAAAVAASPSLTPDLRRKLNDTLDSLKSAGDHIRALRHSSDELEREVAALEAEMSGAESGAVTPSAAASALPGGDVSISLSERDRRRPTVALRVVDAVNSSGMELRDLAGSIESQTENFAEDGLHRWGGLSDSCKGAVGAGIMAAEFFPAAPWNLLSVRGSLPHPRFESLILQSGDSSRVSSSSPAATNSQKLVCRLATIELMEKVAEQLKLLMETGDVFKGVDLPAVGQLVTSLVQRASGVPLRID